MNFPDPTLIATPAFVLLVALEWWLVKAKRVAGDYETKDAITSLVMGTGSIAGGILAIFTAGAGSLAIWQYRVVDELALTPLTFITGFIFYDLIYYWKHRIMHRVRWVWANHVIHHSSEYYNLTTALRQPWTGAISGLFLVGAPMLLLGFHPALVGFIGGVNLVYQFWIHTEAIDKCPRWFEAIFNTPSHHRVHHGRNARYLDANYAGVLIIWDKMFGTFVPELDDEKPDYGLVSPLKSFNPFWVATHEYFAILKDCWSDGLRPWRWIGRLIAPPGWSPTGNHQTSVTFKREWLAQNPEQAGTPGLPTKLLGPASTLDKHNALETADG